VTLLNERQQEAIEATEGAVLVLAGPGTGKTRVISERFAHLVESGKARPEEILTLTFSRKAAGEMETRIVQTLRGSFSRLPVGTFHSFCLRIVMRYYDHLGYDSSPGLVTAQEQWRRVADLLGRQDPAQWDMFPRMLGSRTLVQDVLDFILRAEEYLCSPADIAKLARRLGRRDWAAISPFMATYQAELCRENLIDYGLIIQRAVELLESDTDIRDRVRRAFRYIMVDEYQDTNHSQERLLQLLSEHHGNLFVVGDPAQSIYAFRGTTAANIAAFETTFNARVIRLAESYRSPQELIDLAYRVIEVNGNAAPLQATKDAPATVRAIKHATRSDEMDWLAAEIQRLHVYDRVRYGKIAVLLRSVKDAGPGLEDVLRRHGVPYLASGGGSVLDAPVVRDVIRLLWIAAGDDTVETITAALNSPLFGVDPLQVRTLARDARLSDVSLEEALRAHDSIHAGNRAMAQFVALIDELRGMLDTADHSASFLPSLVYRVWDSVPYFRAVLRRGGEMSALTLGAVTVFHESVARFAERNPDATLTEYLNMIDTMAYADDAGYEPGAVTEDAVRIGSIHQAKGLEFAAVFLPHLVEGFCPSTVRTHSLADLSALSGGPVLSPEQQEAEHLAEERRVFYVGITRAERYLYLSYAEGDGQPSRFIGEALGTPELQLNSPAEDERFLSKDAATIAFRRRFRDPASSESDKLLALYGLASLPGLDPTSWWCHIAPTENSSPLFDSPVHTSFSRLASFENCPSSYRYAVVDLLGDSGSLATNYGGLVHKALDEIFKRPIRSLDDALAHLDEIWDDASFRFLPLSREKKRDARAILESLYVYLGDGEWPDVLSVERTFSFTFDGHTVRGRIDRIDRVGTSGLRLVDYKTGGLKSQNDAREDLQLALYYLACLLDPALQSLGTPEVLEYVYLDTARKKWFASRDQPITHDHQDVTETRLRTIFTGIMAESFAPKKGTWCRYCAFKTLCPLVPEGQVLELNR
jgi:superfamily I DNA/RNA helicase/RecB family exonuclease